MSCDSLHVPFLEILCEIHLDTAVYDISLSISNKIICLLFYVCVESFLTFWAISSFKLGGDLRFDELRTFYKDISYVITLNTYLFILIILVFHCHIFCITESMSMIILM